MSIYRRFGVEPIVNAAGTKTRLGGVRLHPRVLEAMEQASAHSVDMFRLHEAASRVIARHTGAEAGCVTSGAAAAMTLSAAACVTGSDPQLIDRLPDTTGIANRILIFRAHRNSYDHAWRAAGARLVEVGYDDRAVGSGVRRLDRWEIAEAIDEDTVAFAFVASEAELSLLELVAETAHQHGVPVIVDAAAQLPPGSNLRTFIDAGADLVAFSGGKAVGGPQDTGILCGRKDLVRAALLNSLDMDLEGANLPEDSELFPREEFGDRLPRHGIGRGFKVSKEAIVGLLVALESFVAGDWREEARRKGEFAGRVAQVARDAGVTTRDYGSGFPRVELTFAEPADARRVARELAAGAPPVIVEETDLAAGLLTIDTIGLDEAEEALLLRRLSAALGAPA